MYLLILFQQQWNTYCSFKTDELQIWVLNMMNTHPNHILDQFGHIYVPPKHEYFNSKFHSPTLECL